jgi:hypothetical protein
VRRLRRHRHERGLGGCGQYAVEQQIHQ